MGAVPKPYEVPRIIPAFDYFVSYDMLYTEHPNGGEMKSGMGMTALVLSKEVDCWADVAAMAFRIAEGLHNINRYRYNIEVVIRNFIPLKQRAVPNPAILRDASPTSHQ